MRKYTLLFIALLSITYLKAQEPVDEFEVYDRLIARKTQPGYQEGTPWTNDKMYVSNDKIITWYNYYIFFYILYNHELLEFNELL